MPERVIYTLPEVAKLVGISRWKLRRLLENAGVELHRSGRLRLVYLSSLHSSLPELWERVVEAQSLQTK